MKATKSQIEKFAELHNRYRIASDRMLVLQASAVEGMRKIGVGCTTEKSLAEFISLQQEIETVLAMMREMCQLFH